jgi:hypothetical protein
MKLNNKQDTGLSFYILPDSKSISKSTRELYTKCSVIFESDHEYKKYLLEKELFGNKDRHNELCNRLVNYLSKGSVDKKREYSRLIWFLPENERITPYRILKDKISSGLLSKKPQSLKLYSEMIWSLPKKDRDDLYESLKNIIYTGLQSHRPEKQAHYLDLVYFLPEDKKTVINKTLKNKIYTLQRSTELADQKLCVRMIGLIPQEDRKEFLNWFKETIHNKIQSRNGDHHKLCTRMIFCLPESEIKKIAAKLINDSELFQRLFFNRLYIDVTDTSFVEKSFSKTESEIILLGGVMKGNLIIRRISFFAFQAWRKAYETVDLWRGLGFEYVPIEPIQSFMINKRRKLIEVRTGVLDINWDDWSKLTDLYHDEISAKIQKIKDGLTTLQIVHGHDHDSNFCLRFHRKINKQGKNVIDFDKEPRVYCIDFDIARLR